MAVAKKGRPNGRRQALLRAAAEVFFEQGYAATSIDAIIERAGRSDAAATTESFVHEHVWSTVGVGALAGLVLGMLIARR